MRRYRHEADDPDTLSDDTVITVHETSDGLVWAGTYEGGLNALDRSTGEVRRYRTRDGDPGALASDYVRDILEDTEGRLWVATAAGLCLLDRDSDTFTTYANRSDDPKSLGSSYAMTLFQDRGGVLWVGTRGGGVAAWNPRSWSLGQRRLPGLADSVIVAFAADGNNHLWIGTMGAGLQRLALDSGALQPADALFGDALAGLRTMSLLIDSRGHLWVGTMASGVRRIELDSGIVHSYRHDPDDASTLSLRRLGQRADLARYVWWRRKPYRSRDGAHRPADRRARRGGDAGTGAGDGHRGGRLRKGLACNRRRRAVRPRAGDAQHPPVRFQRRR